MSLKDQLASREHAGDVQWLGSKLPKVADQFFGATNASKNVAAETCCLWAQRCQKAKISAGKADINLDILDKLILCVIDRWTQGDPSYKVTLKKFLQSALVVRELLFTGGNSKHFDDLVRRAVQYSRDDPRICYGTLECFARSSPTNATHLARILPANFLTQAFDALVAEEGRSGLIGRFLVVILGNESPEVWYEYTQRYISSNENYQAIMTYFIEPLLKQHRRASDAFAEYYALCKPLSNATVEIGVLKAAKNAKLEVSDQICESPVVRDCLTSPHKQLRYDAFTLLCTCTRKLTKPVPDLVCDRIVKSGDALFAEGDPKSRSDVYSGLRSLLTRLTTSNSDATKLVVFVGDWCADGLAPGSPYRCLAMATRLLQTFDVFLPKLFEKKRVIDGLVNGVVSDFADIRQTCVELLAKAPELPIVDEHRDKLEDMAFRLAASSRGGDAGARILEFLHSRAQFMGLGDRIAQKLKEGLLVAADLLGTDTEAGGETCSPEAAAKLRSVHGYLIALRLVPPTNTPLIPLVQETWHVCSPPLMTLAPEGSVEEVLNFCWKASKECSLLLEHLAKIDSPELNSEVSKSLLSSMATMLADMTHWGAFSALPPAYFAIAKRQPQHAVDIAWKQIHELESREKSRSVTRRSAGLPMLITSTLTARFDNDIVEALFKLAEMPFADGEAEELEMPQVHGMNCLRAVLTNAEITRSSAKFIERALQLALSQFLSVSWSLRNCAAMLFTALFKRLFGVRAFTVSASVFFQRFRAIKGILLQQLDAEQIDEKQQQTIFPVLAILAKLQTTSTDDATMADFWEPIINLLGSPSWKVREMAARVVDSMTHADVSGDAAQEFICSLDPHNQNEMHGSSMAINALLAKSATINDIRAASRARIELILRNNKCMETSIELYTAWTKLGGHERLFSVEQLPHPVNLNPSVATFEAEQVQFGVNNVVVYAKGWSPVLRALSVSMWTLELATSVLQDNTQLPDIQVCCLKVLQTFTADIPKHLALALCERQRPLSVREESLVLLSHKLGVECIHNQDWMSYLQEFSADEAPLESRRCAVRSIHAYLSSGTTNSDSNHQVVWYILFKLLSDEEEDIREDAAKAFCEYISIPPQAAAVCENLLVERIDSEFLTKQLSRNLIEDTELALKSYNDPEELLFIIEEESLFRDEMRSIRIQARHCTPTAQSRSTAQKASKLLEGIDRETPLRAAANKDLVRVEARINALK